MSTRPFRSGNTRQTVRRLITEGLGYCCPWAFFSLFKNTITIALRLGVTTRAVRYAKADFAAGHHRCENCSNCMRKVIEKAKRPE